MLELTYERIYSPPHRFDIRVGSMRVGELRILPYYGAKNSVGGVPGDCLVGASFPLHA